METVANNPEDGQTEILFSHAQVERLRENYICSCLMRISLSKVLSANCKKSASKVQAFTLILYAVLIFCMLITSTYSEVYPK